MFFSANARHREACRCPQGLPGAERPVPCGLRPWRRVSPCMCFLHGSQAGDSPLEEPFGGPPLWTPGTWTPPAACGPGDPQPEEDHTSDPI